MFLKDAIAEYGFDCRIRKLSPKTIDCYEYKYSCKGTMMMSSSMKALMTANQQARQNPFYADLMTRRPAKKHRVFEIGNGVFFE